MPGRIAGVATVELFGGLKMFTPYAFAGVVIPVAFPVRQGFVSLYEKAATLFMKFGYSSLG